MHLKVTNAYSIFRVPAGTAVGDASIEEVQGDAMLVV
jgi:hypothetical protein